MAEARGRKELHTYQNGDTVRLPIEVRDETGVAFIFATYIRLKDPDSPESWDYDEQITLQANAGGQTSGEVVLTGRVANQQPGVYRCMQVEMRDTLENGQVKRNPNNAPAFKVERGPGDRQAPDIVRWGDFQD